MSGTSTAGERSDGDRALPRRNERTLRPGSAVGVGVFAAIMGGVLLVPSLWASERSPALMGTVIAVLILVWLFVVRPCVKVHDEGLRIVNPMRTTDITWPMITQVRSRWVLEVFHDGQKYPAWGLPADPKRPRYGRGLFQLGAAKMAQHTKETPARPKIDAQTVAVEIEARRAADKRRKDGRTPRILERAWDPTAVGLLAVAAAAFVIGVFVA